MNMKREPLRLVCEAPGIRNHNGTPKPVLTVTEDGVWAYCRWSREMEFYPKETFVAYWGEEVGDRGEAKGKQGEWQDAMRSPRPDRTPA